ncbi:MAG TPA: helix-turn-helix domain-containing protein, partial [Hanamia sp.]|nr:helix-turn-helix domain-containing protein [Hanamia sp.]
MKNPTKNKLHRTTATTAFSSHKSKELPEKNFCFFLPSGTKLDDIYIDAQDVATELKICKRIVTNMRKAGKLSYTNLNNGSGKLYYFRQEIAAMLESNTVIGKNSWMKRLG